MFIRIPVLILWLLALSLSSLSQEDDVNSFKQLGTKLPTPNQYRTASGAPGSSYWQQQADYEISVDLDDRNQTLHGEEIITYHNNSPNTLHYLWLQMDQNIRAKDSDSYKINSNKIKTRMNVRALRQMDPKFDGGFNLEYVRDMNKNNLDYTVNKTMMRIDLSDPLQPGEQYSFAIGWWYNINNRMKVGGRSGYEYFAEHDNYLYTIAQFFPRMCVYNDVEGWQNKQFLGRGEFSLPFGNYTVDITVPSDHLVAATGTLVNGKKVLPEDKRILLEKARKNCKEPTIIYSQEEAKEREKGKAEDTKTWVFQADSVRDFAFASSRKFIWDAMGVQMDNGNSVLAMSMYPKEGNPLWEKYSTKAVAHTLKWYSHYTVDYPYPVAWSINAKRIGMEYPMICFNFGRTEEDGTYSERTKYGLISVIIHEVGHNFFPMIINSDERQWTWMDEGLNTFVQYLTEQHWERNYPSRRGPAYKITDYMKGDKENISPIMTNSESIEQFGNNAYAKPATALNILRETILGRDLFDYAFKVYAQRWAFKHPTPADFFRTMEDASAVDLDWFWRSWFYSTNHVDLSIESVDWYQIDNLSPKERALNNMKEDPSKRYITNQRNKTAIDSTYDEIDHTLRDFYSDLSPSDKAKLKQRDYEAYLKSMDEEEKALMHSDRHYYELTFSNKGGIPMPIILKMTFENDSSKVVRIPAEIWRFGDKTVTKVFPTDQRVTTFQLDPYLETADVDTKDNIYPRKDEHPSRFDLFKQKQGRDRKNIMQRFENQGIEKDRS